MLISSLTRNLWLTLVLTICMYSNIAYSAGRGGSTVIIPPSHVQSPLLMTPPVIQNNTESTKIVNKVAISPKNTPSAPVVAAQVVWIKGLVEAKSNNKKARTLQRKDFVYEHETLSTQKGGTGEIVFSDNTLVSLNENTTFLIDQYKYTQNSNHTGEKYIVNVVKGGFRTVTGLISKAGPSNYKINTPVATIGVRGTEIVGFVDANGKGSFSVPHGAADFTNGTGTYSLDQSKQNAIFGSLVSKPTYTSLPDSKLTNIPTVEVVKPSPELVQQSITTSTAAMNSSSSTSGSNQKNTTSPPGVSGGGSSSGGSTGTGTSSSGGSSSSNGTSTGTSTTSSSGGDDSSGTGVSTSSGGSDTSSNASSNSGSTGTVNSNGSSSASQPNGIVNDFSVCK